MARPKPTILDAVIDPQTYIATQILDGKGLWAVFYDGRPFVLRLERPDNGFRYKRTTSPHLTTSIVLKNRLNKQFQTDRFTVVRLV